MAPPERLEEFDGAVDDSYGTTNTNASFDQLREHGRSHQSTMHSQTGAVIDMSSSSLTKAELANLLFEQVGLNKREASQRFLVYAAHDGVLAYLTSLVSGKSIQRLQDYQKRHGPHLLTSTSRQVQPDPIKPPH